MGQSKLTPDAAHCCEGQVAGWELLAVSAAAVCDVAAAIGHVELTQVGQQDGQGRVGEGHGCFGEGLGYAGPVSAAAIGRGCPAGVAVSQTAAPIAAADCCSL